MAAKEAPQEPRYGSGAAYNINKPNYLTAGGAATIVTRLQAWSPVEMVNRDNTVQNVMDPALCWERFRNQPNKVTEIMCVEAPGVSANVLILIL